MAADASATTRAASASAMSARASAATATARSVSMSSGSMSMASILPESPSKTAAFLLIQRPLIRSVADQPAEVCRQVFRELRQSIPSNIQASWDPEIATTPSAGEGQMNLP